MKIGTCFYIRWSGYLIIGAALLSPFVLTAVMAEEVIHHQQIIVRFHSRADASKGKHSDPIESRLQRWQEQFRVTFSYVRPFGKKGWIIAVQERLSADALDQVVQQLNQDPQVKYAEIDAIMNLSPPQDGFVPGYPMGIK